jgi:hypothetical protein
MHDDVNDSFDRGTLTVYAAQSMSEETSNLLIKSHTDISNSLTVYENASFQNNVDIMDTLTVYENASFQNNVDISDNLSVGSKSQIQLLAGAGGLNGTGGIQGDASATSHHVGGGGGGTYFPEKAFNGSLVDGYDAWHNTGGAIPQNLDFVFPYNVIVTKYKIWPRVGFGPGGYTAQNPSAWILQGSNDGGTFVNIDDRTGETITTLSTDTSITDNSNNEEYSVANTANSYKYIRLSITATQDSNGHVSIGEIAYYGYFDGNITGNQLVVDRIFSTGDADIGGNLMVGSGSKTQIQLLAGAGGLNGTGGLQGDATSTLLHNTTYHPKNAFNGTLVNSTDAWHNSGGTIPQNLDFEFPYTVIVTKYKIWPRNHVFSAQNPSSWKLQGSNDGTNFVEIDAQTGETITTSSTSTSITDNLNNNEYSVANTTNSYKYIRLHITTSQNSNGNVSIGEIAYYGYNQTFKYGMVMGVTTEEKAYIQTVSDGSNTPRQLLLNPYSGSDGRVGIGLTAPTEKLDVSGNIKTTGFVKMGQAPVAGEDCVNLTYFNANAGAPSFVGHKNFLTSNSGAKQHPFIFAGTNYNTGLYNTTTGLITIPSAGKYLFNLRLTVLQYSSPGYIGPFLSNMNAGAGASGSGVPIADFFSQTQRTAGTYQNVGGVCVVDCSSGDIFQWNNQTALLGGGTFVAASHWINLCWIETFKVG